MNKTFINQKVSSRLILFIAWELLIDVSYILNWDLVRYDLVDITKEVLQYNFLYVYTQFMSAYNHSDLYGVRYFRIKKNIKIKLI